MEHDYKNCLIVGADDSNHAGDAVGEINTALFSRIYDDSIVRDFSNHRDKVATANFVGSLQRDYRFGLLTSDRYRRSSKNLVETVPELVIDYLKQLDELPDKLQIFIDGALPKYGRGAIREQIQNVFGIEKIVVDNFTKKHKLPNGNVSKHPKCPEILYHADAWANMLYHKAKILDLSQHKKLVFTK